MATLQSLSREIRAALMSNAWYAGLPEAARLAIASRARGRALADGERIFSRGEAPNGVFIVVEGIVRVSGVSSAGRETVLDFYGPGTLIGEVSVLAGGRRGHDADAVGDTFALQLGVADMEELLSSHSAFARSLLRLEAERLMLVLGAIEFHSAHTVEQRLAMRLLRLVEHHGAASARGVEINLDLSHETLARLIGSTRQRVNHILNTWKRARMIEHHYGHIVLRDSARLKALGQP